MAAMIAGDGYAYFPYTTSKLIAGTPGGDEIWESHIMVQRVDTSGNYDKIKLQDWIAGNPLFDFEGEIAQ